MLFRARDGIEPAATEAWIEALKALAGLDGVLHLYVGPVISCKPDVDAWSYALYGRYRDKEALQAYAVHPQHLDVVSMGNTLFSDVMALDWEAHDVKCSSSTSMPSSATPPSALRIVFLQWKHNCLHDDIISWFHKQPLSTSGPNFLPGRARGFEWGFASLYRSEDGLQEDCLKMLSESSVVEKFLIVDTDVRKGAC